ncbi:hypothetical protein BABINDRAFT_27961, partial [Babjeviella inositovora NRRL Y-12698]
AHFPRKPGSTILPTDRLQVAYAKYVPRSSSDDPRTTLNLIFTHGTGMNKSVWRHHIDQLYELSHAPTSTLPWKLGKVLAMDYVNHGDSCVLNKHKMGHKYYWGDTGKDVIKILKHEAVKNTADSRTIGIGHSVGGHGMLYAGFLEPVMFDSIIAVDPMFFTFHKFALDRPDDWEKHRRIHKAIEKNVRDLFANEEECFRWFRTVPFYTKFHPKVLDYFVNDEVIYNADGTMSGKSTTKQQVVAYTSKDVSTVEGCAILPFVTVPVLHLIGSNFSLSFPKEGTDFIRSTIPDCTGATVPDAGHMVHCERFEETIAIMVNWLSKR